VHSPNSGAPGPGRENAVDEFDAIERLRARFEAAARGQYPDAEVPPLGDTWIGDDAAVVTTRAATTDHQAKRQSNQADRAGTQEAAVQPTTSQALLATDLIVAGVHVDLELCSLEDVGYKALMVTVSDLAAMGAWPEYALVSIAGPRGTDFDQLGAGLAAAAAETECVVVGGDLSQSPTLVISTAAFGGLRGDTGHGPLLRSGAGVGDCLFVTGPLGGSAAGLRLLRSGMAGSQATPALARAYRRPRARLRQGEVARWAGATGAIDISDGLVADIGHLARASGVGMALDRLPVIDGATRDEALHGGEEYELLIATGEPERLVGAFEAEELRPPLPIGVCVAQLGQASLEGRPLPPGGWRHQF